MQYAGIIKNDFSAAPGTCVSFFTQGCPHHCEGCQNPETWDFCGGKEFTLDTLNDIINALVANGIHRDLCIMGGEPLCAENQFLTGLVINTVKEKLPNTKIYIWTGYVFDEIPSTPRLNHILMNTDCIIDGPFILKDRDITLPLRGSSNQRVLYKGEDF